MAVKSDTTPIEQPPAILPGSPEFEAAVNAEVRQRLAAAPHGMSMIPSTSLAKPGAAPHEVTLRFHRYTQHQHTAYQRGQEAGFAPAIANALVAGGAATVVHRHA